MSTPSTTDRASKYDPIVLTDDERSHLEKLVRSGKASAQTYTRAHILLLLDGKPPHARLEGGIADVFKVHRDTVKNVRRRFEEGGLERALYDLPRSGAPPKITGDVEAQLTLLACSDPPEGCARWTLQLLADKLVELGVIESVSHTAVGTTLKKTRSSPGRSPASASGSPRPASSR
jgi:putative transposase